MPAESYICQTLLIYISLFGHLCRILHTATNDKYANRDIHMTDETKRDVLMKYVKKNLILHWANTENMSKETCICEKRHSYDRRDQTRSTHNICRKRPHTAQSKHQKHVKRDLWHTKRDIRMTGETKRDLLVIYVERDLILHRAITSKKSKETCNMSKETCKMPKETYVYRRDQTRSAHNMERWGAGVETQKMYGERLGDGVEYHIMSPTPRR